MRYLYNGVMYEARDVDRRSTWDYIYNNIIKTNDDSIGGTRDLSDLFITYTLLDKVGINPKSTYNTPNGIYCYTLEYYASVKGEVPFESTDPKYVTVFKADSSKMLKISHVNETEYDAIISKLTNIANEYKAKLESAGGNTWYFDMGLILHDAKDNALVKSLGGVIWNAIRILSINISKFEKLTKNVNVWSRLITRLGYIGVIDECSGIIHSHEKCQAVVFSKSDITVVDRTTYRKEKASPVRGTRYGTFEWLYSMYSSGAYATVQSKFIKDYMNCIHSPNELSRFLAMGSELVFNRIFANFRVTEFTIKLMKDFTLLDFNRIGRFGMHQLLKIPDYNFSEESPKDILFTNLNSEKYNFYDFDSNIKTLIGNTLYEENNQKYLTSELIEKILYGTTDYEGSSSLSRSAYSFYKKLKLDDSEEDFDYDSIR